VLDVRGGTLSLSTGSVMVDALIATNGANSVVTFNTGTLSTRATLVTNGQAFVVGNGASGATFHLLGGAHSFNNGLRIRNDAVLSGCGTINGSMSVDAGGTVLTDCGAALTFTGIVTNNGTMRAINGSVLEVNGPLVNNGTIDIINGTTNFHSIFINNGKVLDAGSVVIGQTSISGNDVVGQVPSVAGHTYQLQISTSLTSPNWTNTFASQPGTGGVLTFTDPGGATNVPSLFYRVDVTAP
jgi:hypothetical protein